MRISNKVVFGVAIVAVLACSVLVLTARNMPPQPPQTITVGDGDPIILKGGSLTIQCPLYEQCFTFNATTKKFEHKSSSKKIAKIVVKDEAGEVLFSATSPSFPNGKPSVEITYK